MATFAVIQIGGKQYKVGAGDQLTLQRVGGNREKLVFDKVLLLAAAGRQVKIGTPIVSGASVVAKVLGEEKDKKITVIKFRAKSRYRRKMGFRASLSRIRIEEIKVIEKKRATK